MSGENTLLLGSLCLLAGYAFGCFPCGDVAARCTAGAGIRRIGNGRPSPENIRRHLGKKAWLGVVAGDVLKTLLACWFCYSLAAPELEYAAMLYGGLGVVLGHSWPLGGVRGAGMAPVLCAWVAASLPVSGVLCVLAGGVVVAGTGYGALGLVVIPLLAVPVAWLQCGAGGALALAAAAVVTAARQRRDLAALAKGQAPCPARHWPFGK